ncbi:MAG TPA: tetratricopeptide repeat protein [Herpetosiphonaceae bacterium]|nr:tetratricopeptide repeat protein [Herpetosiphonaceae bacterium]
MAPLVHLPTYHTSLIGRAADVSAISDLLTDSSRRIVTLVGASGTGKTRLALEVALSVKDTFADGVVFVALAPVQDARFVLSTIASEFGIQEQSQEPLRETIGRALDGKHLLIILDNLEQIQGIAPDLAYLAGATRQVTILATSQVPLDLDEETIYSVPPLSVPEQVSALGPDKLLQYPSIALFVERLQMVQPQFQLTAANSVPVVGICRLLDGYPLAIELVAAHSASLQPADLLLLLRNHLQMLPHQNRGAFSSRTAILGPVLDWCTSRLPDLAQQLFLRLGVFFGGWTTTAAKAVLAPDVEQAAINEALAVLVQKHLVLIETLPGQDQRYVVLDAVRDYSASRLQRRKQHSAVSERHARYYVGLAEEAETALLGAEQGRWLRRLDEEVHNIRTAMQWSLDNRRPELAQRIAAALFRFWFTRAYFKEGTFWLEAATQAAPNAAAGERAKAWRVLGLMAMFQGDYARTQEAYQRSLELYREDGDLNGQAAVLNNFGIVAQEQGSMDAAWQYYNQSVELLREAKLTNQSLLGTVLNNMGFICEVQGRYQDSLRYHEESLAIRRTMGDVGGIALSLLNLGVIHERHGDYDRARQHYEESLQGYESLGDQQSRTQCLVNLGCIAVELDNYPQAHEYFNEVLKQHQSSNDNYGQATVTMLQGYLALMEEDMATSAGHFEKAQQGLESLGSGQRLLDLYLGRIRLAYAQGDPNAAWGTTLTLLRQAREAGAEPMIVDGVDMAGLLLASRGDREGAARAWAAVNAARAARSTPRAPSLERWYARHAAQWLDLIHQAPADAEPLDQVAAYLERQTPPAA